MLDQIEAAALARVGGAQRDDDGHQAEDSPARRRRPRDRAGER
jgi:hypothetical protein